MKLSLFGKMTNKEDENDEFCDPRVAALLAVHLVSQVLDEAYVIANAAKESGQPWRYILTLKNLSKLDDMNGENTLALTASEGNIDESRKDSMDSVANDVVTSTPQKTADDTQKLKNELFLVGQGDEDVGIHNLEFNKSTSMFINQMFDISEVERVISCEDIQTLQCSNTLESNDSVAQDIAKIMDFYVNFALNSVLKQEIKINEHNTAIESPPTSTEHSSYSVLADACIVECGGEDALCIHDDANLNHEFALRCSQITPDVDVTEPVTQNDDNIEKNDIGLYENAYATLNRDYEQYSDDDDNRPMFEDSKMLSLQEVELLTAPSSDDNLSLFTQSLKKPKEPVAPTVVSGSACESRKSGFVRRWRLQGARLIACLQGWWRRKTPGKRKKARTPGIVRGLCPLSPEARRRAVSLLDQRQLGSPSPTHSIIWKFNTVNEALVNSSRWKDYAFETEHHGTEH